MGLYPISDITNAVLNKFFACLLKPDVNTAKAVSEKTAKDILSVIKAAIIFAVNESLIGGFAIKVSLPKEKLNDMRVLSTDEQMVLEKYLCADMDEYKLGIYLCLYTGLRVGEICSLMWHDISLEEKILTVSRTMQRVQALSDNSSAKTKIIITDPKSNFSIRLIPLPEWLVLMLNKFRPADISVDAYLLTGDPKRYIEPRTLQNRFKTCLQKSGIKKANFHALRHTVATRCVSLGFEIKCLSEILGHSNVNITLNRYVHPSFDMKRSNMDKLEALHE